MKFNKWTLGLAAVGVVSLASVAQAEEKSSMVMTAVSSTTLSGYVDTSVIWAPGTGNNSVPGYAYNGGSRLDGFNLDAVMVRLNKPLDETPWASGYNVDLFFGQDANVLGTSSTGIGTSSDFVIKQAYVTLRTPVGNGIDWKLGVFDNWIGYESTEAPSNPNFSRSYGYTIEPTTFTGLMGSYKISELISVAGGIANTTGPGVGAKANVPGSPPSNVKPESTKAYLASVALTAPNDWGAIAGSTLYAGFVNGWNANVATPTGGSMTDNIYVGATINTPVAGLKAGASYDYASGGGNGGAPIWADAIAGYASYQATEKLSVHGRLEYAWFGGGVAPLVGTTKVFATTATVQYDLWKNVLSRLEVRWDHSADGSSPWGGVGAAAGGQMNWWTVAANVAYKF